MLAEHSTSFLGSPCRSCCDDPFRRPAIDSDPGSSNVGTVAKNVAWQHTELVRHLQSPVTRNQLAKQLFQLGLHLYPQTTHTDFSCRPTPAVNLQEAFSVRNHSCPSDVVALVEDALEQQALHFPQTVSISRYDGQPCFLDAKFLISHFSRFWMQRTIDLSSPRKTQSSPPDIGQCQLEITADLQTMIDEVTLGPVKDGFVRVRRCDGHLQDIGSPYLYRVQTNIAIDCVSDSPVWGSLNLSRRLNEFSDIIDRERQDYDSFFFPGEEITAGYKQWYGRSFPDYADYSFSLLAHYAATNGQPSDGYESLFQWALGPDDRDKNLN